MHSPSIVLSSVLFIVRAALEVRLAAVSSASRDVHVELLVRVARVALPQLDELGDVPVRDVEAEAWVSASVAPLPVPVSSIRPSAWAVQLCCHTPG